MLAVEARLIWWAAEPSPSFPRRTAPIHRIRADGTTHTIPGHQDKL